MIRGTNKYDVFICCRAMAGREDDGRYGIVNLLNRSLSDKGFRVFWEPFQLDITNSVNTDSSIIRRANNFILLLTDDVFDGCSNPNDSIRVELELALLNNCNIVPIDISRSGLNEVFKRNFPPSLEHIRNLNITSFSPSLTQSFLDRLNKVLLNVDFSNAWVFLSHSNKDFEKIIRIRNRLEELDYRPLLFFLKCLDDDKEVFELIKREIRARDRFILCDSKNSRESEWVQKEVDYIKSLGRPYELINLDAGDDEIDRCIERFDERSTVFIWSTSDEIADIIAENLINKAFKVGILPSTYLNDYLDYKRGLNVKDFQVIDANAYIAIVIDRELSSSQMQVIDSCSDFFRAADNDTFLLYVVANNDEEKRRLIKSNEEFLKEMYQGNGIHPRYITVEGSEKQSESIMRDIIDLDNYHHNI